MRIVILLVLMASVSSCATVVLDQRLVFGGSYRDKEIGLSEGVTQSFVFFRNRNGKLMEGILFEKAGATSNTILFPGNGGIGPGYKNFARLLQEKLRTNVFIPNYQGYGYSDGQTDVDQLITDGMDAVQYLQERCGRRQPLYVLGYSIGSYCAIHVSTLIQVKGVGVVAPFSTLSKVWSATKGNYVPFVLLPFINFQLDDKVSKMSNVEPFSKLERVLVVIGRKDTVFPVAIGNELAVANKQALVKYVDEATHQSLMDQQAGDVVNSLVELYAE